MPRVMAGATTPAMTLMRHELVDYAVKNGVATLTLTNPPANAYSYNMMRDLDQAVLEARFDESVHVIVLAGAGEKFFCAGADIAMLNDVTPTFKYNFCLHANETIQSRDAAEGIAAHVEKRKPQFTGELGEPIWTP